jgi:hypothetical protein
LFDLFSRDNHAKMWQKKVAAHAVRRKHVRLNALECDKNEVPYRCPDLAGGTVKLQMVSGLPEGLLYYQNGERARVPDPESDYRVPLPQQRYGVSVRPTAFLTGML